MFQLYLYEFIFRNYLKKFLIIKCKDTKTNFNKKPLNFRVSMKLFLR